MKITATQKFLNAMKLAQEQKDKHNEQMSRLLWELYQSIPKEAQIERIDEVFNALYNEFNKYEQHPYDSFQNCIFRILQWELNSQLQNEGNEYFIGSEFGEHCLSFSEHRVDGRYGLCGGIIYHGFPDTGYKENGSVQLEGSYGWSTHT